ncbi:t-SNARE coiled-coil-like proteiny domain-containing protein [Entamoeba marina]
MDLTKVFHHQVALKLAEVRSVDVSVVEKEIESEVDKQRNLHHSFVDVIKDTEQKIIEVNDLLNTSFQEVLFGGISITQYTNKNSLSSNLEAWSKEMYEKMSLDFLEYLIEQLQNKIKQLLRLNNNQTKLMLKTVNLNSELLFTIHPELLNPVDDVSQNDTSVLDKSPSTKETTNGDEFDNFDITQIQPKPINEPITPTVEVIKDVNFDSAWEQVDNEEDNEEEELMKEEHQLVQLTQTRMNEVFQAINKRIDAINELNTKIGEISQIQLEQTQHIIDAHWKMPKKSITSWWSPKRLAAVVFYVGGFLLLLSHFTSK